MNEKQSFAMNNSLMQTMSGEHLRDLTYFKTKMPIHTELEGNKSEKRGGGARRTLLR